MSGCYQLPLYQGCPTEDMLKAIHEKGYEKSLQEEESKKTIKFLSNGASVVVSLIDRQINDCFFKHENYFHPSKCKDWIRKRINSNKYEPKEVKKADLAKKINIPKKVSTDEFEKQANLAFKKQVNQIQSIFLIDAKL
mmetsp:Transcript_4843/g.6133  ORF Transcript_4843/g.6133 Transcript_4843/m.6133 type:complete len:138 (-) Transcript_4843:720-1133(-)|eukprot:CAMPEP_0204850574 /NCGR_PEP_ID=MMETSP1347-20130617/8415_1 /ASSEMBLY_ACC=CAM_ASM_000690 /TAXON_ID=215587 /ORGANISM="Aplanochytrium stocchinoi, Strain GSBS06" /LENGTH=137 /DNA_ID=CAMNT_0051993641 /DNA_START=124 /DNA_END=537 /DNA_ORIENTATION=+